MEEGELFQKYKAEKEEKKLKKDRKNLERKLHPAPAVHTITSLMAFGMSGFAGSLAYNNYNNLGYGFAALAFGSCMFLAFGSCEVYKYFSLRSKNKNTRLKMENINEDLENIAKSYN